VAPELGLNV